MDPKTLQKVIEMLEERAGWRTTKALNVAEKDPKYAEEMEARADELLNFSQTLKQSLG